MITEAVTELKT